MKEIKGGHNKMERCSLVMHWKNQYHWTSTVPATTYRFHVILIKMLITLFAKLGGNIFELLQKHKRQRTGSGALRNAQGKSNRMLRSICLPRTSQHHTRHHSSYSLYLQTKVELSTKYSNIPLQYDNKFSSFAYIYHAMTHLNSKKLNL